MTQTLTPANAAAVFKKYGGISIEQVQQHDSGLVIGLFAPGGTGKTTLAASITDSPLGGPALYLNARGNPHVVSSYGDKIAVATINKFADVENVRQDLLKDKEAPFKTIIYDTVTEMYAIALRDAYGPIGDVKWENHSKTTAQLLQMVRNAVDLAEGPRKMNVIFVFQEVQETRTIRGEKDVRRTEISLNTALQSQVPGIVTFLGRLYIDQDFAPFTRLLDFTPAEKMQQAKFQVDPHDPLTKMIPMKQWNPSLASLVDTVRGRQPWPLEKHAKKQ